MSTENNKSTIIKLAIILFAITFIATLALTVCNYLTKGQIDEISAQKANEAKQAVISDADFEEIQLDDKTKKEIEGYKVTSIFKATKNGEFAGYCVNVIPEGFGGGIDMFVGIDKDLETITGIKIISMAETPGLGAKAQEENFSGQFANKKGELKVVKNSPNPTDSEINAISGATITSDAVTQGVNNALAAVKLIHEKEAE